MRSALSTSGASERDAEMLETPNNDFSIMLLSPATFRREVRWRFSHVCSSGVGSLPTGTL
ncbi:hypothetical protein KTAU_32740 [Thermogemmatispora aurantia]|uniref:Uncharacterized protein n=1 Tax=Thermogemmatispora aurantia TaxID=2045279 RepID=A0A5J4K7N7_9CHLR|nr:hypothetical protein [Thermogemmatispora aurantia]GER84638.1 hypothetical protein KTAU_32740 [Thermogemmatispora aurantia]